MVFAQQPIGPAPKPLGPVPFFAEPTPKCPQRGQTASIVENFGTETTPKWSQNGARRGLRNKLAQKPEKVDFACIYYT